MTFGGKPRSPREHLTANCGGSGLSSHEALLLVGHGSARYSDAGTAMHRHAEALRARGQFGQVEVAVLNGAPSVSDALAAIGKPIVRVVPFFMEEGYFSQVAVPRAIGAATSGDARQSRRVNWCPPVGVHAGMAARSSSAGPLASAAGAPVPRAPPRFWSPAMGLPLTPAELWRCTGTLPVSPRPPSSLGWKPPAWRKPRS